jgi:hypothetical protein
LNPTISRSLPLSATAARIAWSCSSSTARGFSTNTALPAARASPTIAAWAWWRVAISTASTAPSASRPRWSVEQRSKPNLRWALVADSPVAVATSTSRTSSRSRRWGRSMLVA